jgi:hypothetical protein
MTKYKDSHTRWQFANVEELVDYIAHLSGIEPLSNQSIRGTGSQVRHLRKVKASESNPALFHNPVLDHITSPYGELVIGSQSFNIRARRLGSSRRGIVTLDPPASDFTAAHALMCYQDFSGLEICQSDDGSLRTYMDGNASMTFRAYTDSTGPYWEMGAEIKTLGLNFEAAIINSRYFGEAYAQTCTIQTYDDDSDTNDNYLDEYEWGIKGLASQLIRVESLCRVQWNDCRISGVVSAGRDCYNVGTIQPWPDGYPEDWPPLNEPDPIETIGVRPAFLEFTSRPSRPSVTKTITVASSFLNPVTVTVEDAKVDTSPTDPTPFDPPNFGGVASGEFSNVSGQLIIPPNSSVNIAVTFTGESGLGSVPGSLRVTWNSGQFTVGLLGRLVQELLP